MDGKWSFLVFSIAGCVSLCKMHTWKFYDAMQKAAPAGIKPKPRGGPLFCVESLVPTVKINRQRKILIALTIFLLYNGVVHEIIKYELFRG